jgi:hypothetical protein
MRPVRIRRRSDGIIELRRTRLRDVAVGPDAAILAAMLIGTVAFLTLVATTLVESPLLVTIPSALALVGFWGGGVARRAREETAEPDRPEPPRAA